ncbi:Trp operon repressor [Actinobacillus equuli]|nr:Trp operon repressor [Actinobacillus equuli]
MQIVAELLKGEVPQREIQQNLNTSAATITRASNMLKTLEPQFIEWLNEKLNGKA